MDDTTAATGTGESLDSVVRKYAAIWIWSILCAAVAGLFVGSGNGLLMLSGWRFGTGNLMDAQQAIAFVASLLVSVGELVAMWYLYQFFSRCLLPLLFSGMDPADPEIGPRVLRRAFGSVLCALAVQVAGGIAGFLLRLSLGVR
ncbi:MAG: hypothetical protein WBL61_13725 [Bryobacteraceae bacterium]